MKTQKTYTQEEKQKMIKKAFNKYQKNEKPLWDECEKKLEEIKALPENKVCEKCGQEIK